MRTIVHGYSVANAQHMQFCANGAHTPLPLTAQTRMNAVIVSILRPRLIGLRAYVKNTLAFEFCRDNLRYNVTSCCTAQMAFGDNL